MNQQTKDLLLSLGKLGPGVVAWGIFLSGSPMWKFSGKGPKSYSPGFLWKLHCIVRIGKIIDHWQLSSTSSPFPLPGEWMGGGTESSKPLFKRLVFLATSLDSWVGSKSHIIYIRKESFITLNSGNSKGLATNNRNYRKRHNISYNIAGWFCIMMGYVLWSLKERKGGKIC